MNPGWACLSVHGETPWLAVSVQPNAKVTTADGLHDDTLRVRLNAPPVDGKANQALIDWLAGELRLPRRAITLVRGETSRRKWLAIEAPVDRLEAWLTAKTSPPPSRPVR